VSRDQTGASNPNARTTQLDVDAMRILHAYYSKSERWIARAFGMSTGAVHAIVTRRSWAGGPPGANVRRDQ